MQYLECKFECEELYEYLMITNVMEGVNNFSMKTDDRQKLDDLEMNSLSSMC